MWGTERGSLEHMRSFASTRLDEVRSTCSWATRDFRQLGNKSPPV